jgi:hypothetical protein
MHVTTCNGKRVCRKYPDEPILHYSVIHSWWVAQKYVDPHRNIAALMAVWNGKQAAVEKPRALTENLPSNGVWRQRDAR